MTTPVPQNRVAQWIEYRLPVFSWTNKHLIDYPAPRNLNYWWNFGSLAGILLVLQIVTGVVLAMHYTPHADLAFDSVEHIMRDVEWGWLMRYLHANGGSMFFAVVYIHLFRGLYYGSYKAPREILWWMGVIILLLMMASAFMGYVLPWGQMSFWAATVITNMTSAIPWIGETVVTWLWGGFSVDHPTLNRFYALHYLLPFVLFGVVFIHLWALHHRKSNNPLGIDIKSEKDTIPFHPYYTAKDSFGIGVMMFILLLFTFYMPNMLGEVINYEKANPLQTPAHIVPEWYFLPFYAILRAIPGQARRRRGDGRLDLHPLHPALAGYIQSPQRALPPDLQVGVLGLRRRLHRARLGRRQHARRQLHLDRPGHDRLLLRALPPHPAAHRQVRAAHAAAGEHPSGGAERRR